MKNIAKLIFSVIFLSATTAHSFSIDFNQVISGGSPAGPAPWLSATFTDASRVLPGDLTATPGVLLTLSAPGLAGTSEFTTYWGFNTTLSGLAGLQHLDTLTGVTGLNSFSTGNDSIRLGTGALYDLGIGFSTTNRDGGINRFQGGDLAELFLYGVAGLTAESFNALSSPSDKAYLAEAHVQGIPGATEDSAWVVPGTGAAPEPVPEPGTMILLGAGLFSLAVIGKRRRNAQ